MLSIEELSARIAYDALSGYLWHRPSVDKVRSNRWGKRRAFTSKAANGALVGVICGQTILAHRAAWALHFGAWPTGNILHKNGDKTDNRLDNLESETAGLRDVL